MKMKMKRQFAIVVLACVMALAIGVLAGCTSSSSSSAASASGSASAASASASAASTSAASASASAASASASSAAASSASASAASATTLADGTYTAKFDTDNSMFHVNEANEGKGILTVKDGQMTIHVVLAGKGILNLYPGLADDAKKDGAVLLQPTTEEVKYKDGTTDEAYAFDIPVPAIDEPFDVALVGEKGKWYDHKVSVSNVEPAQ